MCTVELELALLVFCVYVCDPFHSTNLLTVGGKETDRDKRMKEKIKRDGER